MNERKFLRCKHCGNVIEAIIDTTVPVFCCGEAMELLAENTIDTKIESHQPVAARSGGLVTVSVGARPHPMTAEHHIAWILIAQGSHTVRADLDPLKVPQAVFAGITDQPFKAYAYCNLHGLWSSASK